MSLFWGCNLIDCESMGSEGDPNSLVLVVQAVGGFCVSDRSPPEALSARTSSRTATREKLPLWSSGLPTRNKVGMGGDPSGTALWAIFGP